MKKFFILFSFLAFISLFLSVKPVFADSSSAVKEIVLQASPDFLGKSSTPTRVDTMNVTIYAFTTNGGQAQPKPAPEDIKLTLTLTNSLGQSVVIDNNLLISKDQVVGSLPIQFPSEGKWTISATGTLNDGTPLSSINITTNIDIIYVGTPNKLSLSPFTATISRNKTQQYTAQLIYSDGSSYDATNEVTWTAGPSFVASIDSKGLATGLNIGVARINAYDPVFKFSEYALLIVAPLDVELTISPPSSKIGVGGTQQFQATMSTSVMGIISSSMDVTPFVLWTSTKSDVASITSMSNPSGLAKGLSPGITQIAATLPLAGSAASTLEVEGLKLIPQSSTISIGDKLPFVLKLINSDLTELVVTDSAHWVSSDSTIAGIDDGTQKGLATGISEGSATITASYNGMSASANLTVQKLQVLDHFGFVHTPNLMLRYDVDPANNYHSTWSYIGEQMHLDVYLQAYTSDGTAINNYLWDTEWFRNAANWSIISNGTGIDLSKLTISTYGEPIIDKDSVLRVQFIVVQDDAIRDKAIKNVSISVKPKDISGVKPLAPTQAVIPNQGTTFNLYGGQIRVAQAYFYRVEGNAQVYVEKYDGQFVQNTDDSLTSVSTWDLSGTTVTPSDFKFTAGSGEVGVASNASNVTKTLTPIGVQPYFRIVPGMLTWGQIVNIPPPQQNEGTVWERELPP